MRIKAILIILIIVLVSGYALADCDCDKERNEEAGLSENTIISGDKAIIFIYDMIATQDKPLRNDLLVLKEQTDIRDIEIWVNSPGGIVYTGFAIVDMINAAEKDGFKITGRAVGIVASIAIPILLACNNRIAGENTLFMVHEAQGQLQGSSSDFKATNEMFGMFNEIYIDNLERETKIKDRSRWEEWMEKTEWFNSKTALERGVIQKIE